jgi:glycosyltransferase 2 family protein
VKLALNIFLSLVVLGLCLWLVWPDAHTRHQLTATLHNLRFADFWPYLAGYIGLLAATHFFRAWRWNNLLRPMGVDLPAGKLLAISSVGFMAILALPARLGEFVRPALLRKKGRVSASAVLGTVAVERIVDGLMVSLFVFSTCLALRGGPHAKGWMMPMAWASLGVFLAAMIFLAAALKWPERTVKICVAMTLTPRFAPRIAGKLDAKLRLLISGFKVLHDVPNLIMFVIWSALYWVANGVGMWVLARGFGLDLSIVGAFAVMGIIAVGITLPNSPGLVGQFHYLTTLGLSLYLASDVANSTGLAYAIMLHGIQVVWYIGMGAISLLTPWVSFSDAFRPAPDEEPGEARQEAA